MRRIIIKLSNIGLLNNRLFNNLLIGLRLDDKFAHYINVYNYQNHENPDKTKSLQEIAGYSETPEMNELLDYIHTELMNYSQHYLPNGGNVLDIGCGPGLFLKDFDERYNKRGIDIMPEMIELAKNIIPNGNFYIGNIINEKIDEKFDMIFSVGALMYISKSTMRRLKNKLDQLLNPGGILFISYPHAIARKDLSYPDLNYIQYSPNYVERLFSRGYEVLEHSRSVDKKKIGSYDEKPFSNAQNPAYKTYKNSSIIVLRKK